MERGNAMPTHATALLDDSETCSEPAPQSAVPASVNGVPLSATPLNE
jgi:hypothetical protein